MKHTLTQPAAKRTVSFILAGTLAATSLVPTSFAYSAPSDELKQQLASATAQLDALEQTLFQTEAELGKTTFELNETKENIAELEGNIAENTDKLTVAKGRLATVVEESYKQGGDLGLLDLVLSSESFDKLMSRIYYANKVAENKRQEISTVNDLQVSLHNDKALLEEQQVQQEELLASQETQRQAMEAAATQQANYVGQLSTEVVAAMEEERRQATQASLEAARKVLGDDAVNQAVSSDVSQAINSPQNETKKQDEQAQGDDQAKKANGEEQAAPKQQEQKAPEQQEEAQQNQDTEEEQESNDYEETPVYTPPVYTPPAYTPPANTSSSSSGAALVAVQAAIAQVGKPYGHDNDGNNFDCNGLTHYAWAQAGVEIPYASGHYAYGQFQWMKSSGRWVTSASALKAGDLVFFSHDGGYTTFHVAMYIGSGQIVHAVGYSQGIQVTSLDYVSGFCGGGSPI